MDVSDGLENFEEINVITVESGCTKLDEPVLERGEPYQPCSLRDHFYPPQTSPQSCFDLRPILEDVIELNLYYILVLPKFTSFEDPHLFISELEEVCSLIHMPRVPIDVVMMKFDSFGLEDDAKRQMHSLKVGSTKS